MKEKGAKNKVHLNLVFPSETKLIKSKYLIQKYLWLLLRFAILDIADEIRQMGMNTVDGHQHSVLYAYEVLLKLPDNLSSTHFVDHKIVW